MKKKVINALIIDDNPIIGRCMDKRISKINETYSNNSNFVIIPHFYEINISSIKTAGSKIENIIRRENINTLLLDRGFFNVIDPDRLKNHELNSNHLYVKKGDKSIKIQDILTNVSFNKIRKFDLVIVYSFDDPNLTSEWYIEPAKIKRDITDSIGSKVEPNDIEVVLTNSDLYNLAGIDLYEGWGREQIGDYVYHGNKSDFALYGLFIGEILYHKIIRINETKKNINKIEKNEYTRRNLFILFMIFTALSIGGNSAYSYISEQINSDIWLVLLSLVFSLIIPYLILVVKPEWLINIDD